MFFQNILLFSSSLFWVLHIFFTRASWWGEGCSIIFNRFHVRFLLPSPVLTWTFAYNPFIDLNGAGLLPPGLVPAVYFFQVRYGANVDDLLCEYYYFFKCVWYVHSFSAICSREKESLYFLTCSIFPKISTSIFKLKKKKSFREMCFLYKATEEWPTPINICVAHPWLPKTLT